MRAHADRTVGARVWARVLRPWTDARAAAHRPRGRANGNRTAGTGLRHASGPTARAAHRPRSRANANRSDGAGLRHASHPTALAAHRPRSRADTGRATHTDLPHTVSPTARPARCSCCSAAAARAMGTRSRNRRSHLRLGAATPAPGGSVDTNRPLDRWPSELDEPRRSRTELGGPEHTDRATSRRSPLRACRSARATRRPRGRADARRATHTAGPTARPVPCSRGSADTDRAVGARSPRRRSHLRLGAATPAPGGGGDTNRPLDR